MTMRERYPELAAADARTRKAIDLYREIARWAREGARPLAFTSGLATDAHFGYLTRQHGDADLIAPAETVEALRSFLASRGYVVYEPDALKGECLKVDQAASDQPLNSHCDIHYCREDEEGRLMIPLFGKELKLSAGMADASVEREFLGERAQFLRPAFLLEEKVGWRDQIGLPFGEKEVREVEKLRFLAS